MYHIVCLDESGHFDPQDTKRSLIAGFIYTPHEGWTWEEEKKQLFGEMLSVTTSFGYAHDYLVKEYEMRLKYGENYFARQTYESVLMFLKENPDAWELPLHLVKEVWGLKDKKCPTFGFPACLHSTFSDKEMFPTIADGLIGYIRKQNELYKDSYRLFAVIKDQLIHNSNQIADDNVAANLYHHMLTAAIHNTVFSNPSLSVGEHHFRLELPTRQHVIVKDPLSEEAQQMALMKLKEMTSLGLSPWRADMISGKDLPTDWKKKLDTLEWERLYFYLPEKQALHEMLRTELVSHPDVQIAIDDISVTKIDYYKHNHIPGAGQYLADILCYYVNQFVRNHISSETMFEAITNDTASVPLILEYPNDSDLLKSIDLALRQEHLDDYVDYRFSANRTLLQRRHMEMMDDQKLHALFTEHSLVQAYLREEMLFLASEYQQALKETDWIYKKADRLNLFDGKAQIKFKYANLLMRLYQHAGDSRSANFAEVCAALQHTLSPEDKQRHQIQMISTYENVFDFDRALKAATSIAKTAAKVYKAHGQKHDLNYAKAVGKLAQNKAFLKKKANKDFERALALIPEEDNANRSISLSYFLHYAIDRGDEKTFWKYAVMCFGKTTETSKAAQMLEWINSFKDIDQGANRFSMFVLAKACYVLYGNLLIQPEWSDVAKLICSIYIENETHPNALIMKYQALIGLVVGEKEQAERVHQALKDSVSSQSQILYLINCSCVLELALHLSDVDEQIDYTNRIKQFVEEHRLYHNGLTRVRKTSNPNQILDCFTYMYR